MADVCPFCEIVSGRAPAAGLARHFGSVSFTPLNPATPGHTLVVPVEHTEGVWDIENVDWAQSMGIAHEIAEDLRRELNPDGMNIIQSTGAAATQTVPHLHIHVVPRYVGDRMGPIWPVEGG